MKKPVLIFCLIFNLHVNAQVPNYVPTSSLVAWYSFNGNANDLSGNLNNGSVNGANLTTDRFTNANSAYSFNGASSYIQLPNTSNITPPHITLSFWCKIGSNQSDQKIIRQRGYGFEASYNLTYAYGSAAANKLSTNLFTSGSLNYSQIHNTVVNDFQWHHTAFTYDGLDYKVYIDGALVYQVNNNGPGSVFYSNTGNGFAIGRDGDNPAYYFSGSFDDLGIWSRALTLCEIQQLYTTLISPTTLNVVASSTAICVGQTATLSATGGTSYTWQPSGSNGVNYTVTPNSTGTYSVVSTNSAGCISSSSISLIVNSNPTVIASSSPSIICSGNSASLNASGAISYTWEPGNFTTTAVSISPSISTTYTLLGSDANGCTNSLSISLIVNPNPTISASSSPSVICSGSSASLNASGASSYTWQPGNFTTTAVSISPSITTTYTVLGSDVNGCTNSSTVVQNVSSCTSIHAVSAVDEHLFVYPNPNEGNFMILTSNAGILMLTDGLGQLIKSISSAGQTENQFMINDLPAGIYFVTGYIGQQSVNQKIVVAK